ncbi:MAG: DHH family phosphoesterase [Litorilituus sp.]|jgi:hypothetical protein|nr:DHH family phosphoesterase [Litorilituus sp.]
MHYDVFNGDADGLIALLQLRLSTQRAQPKDSRLITGVKRDINLLKLVDVAQALSVTVLDISLEKNAEALNRLLENKVEVFYVDHHRAGDLPDSNFLSSIIDTDANTCTSLLVNNHLNGEFVYWAIAAAFGDNMQASAQALAVEVGLSMTQQTLLQELGIYINYNGYGSAVEDLHFHPADLYHQLLHYPDPFVLIAEQDSIFAQLKSAYLADMSNARNAKILVDTDQLKAVQLSDQSWARRVSGVYGNELANSSPDKAHIVVTQNKNSTYTISLRAPLNNKQGAGDLCAQFPTGGGRAAAAGINALPEEILSDFIDCVSKYYL